MLENVEFFYKENFFLILV